MAIARASLMAAILLFTVCAAVAFAADENNIGRAMYLQYCGACHGPSGKGDGVAGTFMRPKPSDLTQIAKRDNGQFPYQHVVQVIDGTNPVRPHGESDMPSGARCSARRPGRHWVAAPRCKRRSCSSRVPRSIQEK